MSVAFSLGFNFGFGFDSGEFPGQQTSQSYYTRVYADSGVIESYTHVISGYGATNVS
jgi:hypothetical protein